MKDQCEEVVQNEGNQEMAEIEDSEEVERMKINENSEKMDQQGKDKSFVFSESQFFNEFL